MKNHLHSFLFIISLGLLLEGCSSIVSPPPSVTKISFGGYHFAIPKSPDFIGASAYDALIITLNEHAEKAVFTLSDYKNIDDYNLSAEAFLSVIYGSETTKNKELNDLKDAISQHEVSRHRINQGDKVIYIITYQTKEYAVIYNRARSNIWVSIETTGMNMSRLIDSLEYI